MLTDSRGLIAREKKPQENQACSSGRTTQPVRIDVVPGFGTTANTKIINEELVAKVERKGNARIIPYMQVDEKICV